MQNQCRALFWNTDLVCFELQVAVAAAVHGVLLIGFSACIQAAASNRPERQATLLAHHDAAFAWQAPSGCNAMAGSAHNRVRRALDSHVRIGGGGGAGGLGSRTCLKRWQSEKSQVHVLSGLLHIGTDLGFQFVSVRHGLSISQVYLGQGKQALAAVGVTFSLDGDLELLVKNMWLCIGYRWCPPRKASCYTAWQAFPQAMRAEFRWHTTRLGLCSRSKHVRFCCAEWTGKHRGLCRGSVGWWHSDSCPQSSWTGCAKLAGKCQEK